MANLSDELRFPRLAPFDALRRNIDQVFADFTHGVGFVPTPLDEAAYEFRPKAELHESGAITTIRIELPGVDLKDISLQVTHDTIEVTGEKRCEVETQEGDLYHSERSFGAFSRQFTLPFAVDADAVEASFDNGVLTIRVPIPPQHRDEPRRVAIQS